MLLKELQFCKDLIFEEKEKLFVLKSQRWEYHHGEPYILIKQYGPYIDELKALFKSNDETLKDLKRGLLAHFNGHPLLSEVKIILNESKALFRRAGPVISQYHDFIGRVETEIYWLNKMRQKAEHVYGLLSSHGPLLAGLESRISDLKTRVSVLSKERPHCQPLDALSKLWEDADMLSKDLVLFTQETADLCLISKNLSSLLNEKIIYAARFHIAEQDVKRDCHEVVRELSLIEFKVKHIAHLCALAQVAEVHVVPVDYEQMDIDKATSWRIRPFREKNILGTMRVQGRDMCAFVSTVVMTESLFKRFLDLVIKLSEHHLQDIVRVFCANNAMKGKHKLVVCLGRMIDTGIVSESTYNGADFEAMDFCRYHISGFEPLTPGFPEEAVDKLDDAIVLIGVFGITKGYFSLGPDDVYDAPQDSEFETGQSGNTLTHAVVIVGYGRTLAGTPFYVYQNWYGPGWGKDSFGMVTARSIRQLYAAEL